MRVIDNEKEYFLAGGSLLVQDLEDREDCCQVDQREFSEFEREVFNFLVKIEGEV